MKKKLFAIIFAAVLVLSTTVLAQTVKNNGQDRVLSPELKQSAEKMLDEVVREIKRLKIVENRIRARTTAADLLWQQDENAARGVFQDALGELQKMTGAINLPNGLEGISRAEKSEHYSKRFALAELRREFLLILPDATRSQRSKRSSCSKSNRLTNTTSLPPTSWNWN